MTDRIPEIERLLSEATPGPWSAGDGGGYFVSVLSDHVSGGVLATMHASDGDAALIAAAPDLLRWSVTEIASLRAEVERLRAFAVAAGNGMWMRIASMHAGSMIGDASTHYECAG